MNSIGSVRVKIWGHRTISTSKQSWTKTLRHSLLRLGQYTHCSWSFASVASPGGYWSSSHAPPSQHPTCNEHLEYHFADILRDIRKIERSYQCKRRCPPSSVPRPRSERRSGRAGWRWGNLRTCTCHHLVFQCNNYTLVPAWIPIHPDIHVPWIFVRQGLLSTIDPWRFVAVGYSTVTSGLRSCRILIKTRWRILGSICRSVLQKKVFDYSMY